MNFLPLDNPLALTALPLCVAPLFASPLRVSNIASIAAVPEDALSRLIQKMLKTLGVVATASAIVAAAGPYVPGAEIEVRGEGAQIVMLIDRSGSMNESFAGRTPTGGEESKAAASKRILRQFVNSRRHDLVGVALFSTAPMLATPLGDHPNATMAAIDAIDRPGLDYTNIGRGLAMSLAMFKAHEADRSRAIVLISDGAGVIDPKIKEDLRGEFKKANVDLYWLFLRTAGSAGIQDKPDPDADTPQAAPERHLDLFFKTLGVPYRAFEAEGPQATAEALREIDRLERRPVRYFERAPRMELAPAFIVLALGAAAGLLLAKLSESTLSGEEAKR